MQKEAAVLENEDQVRYFAFSPDGRSLAVSLDHIGSARKNQLVIWDLKSRAIQFRLEQGRTVWDMTFFGDGSRLAVASNAVIMKGEAKQPQLLRVWDTDTGEELARLDAEPGNRQRKPGLYRLAASPNGKWLAAHQYRTAAKGDIILWDAETLTVQRTLRGAGGLHQMQFTPDSKLLAGGMTVRSKASRRGTIAGVRLWNVAEGKQVAETAFDAADADSGSSWFVFAPDSRSLLASALLRFSGDQRHNRCEIRLWEFASGRETDLGAGWGDVNFGNRPRFWHFDADFAPTGDVLAVSDCETHPQVRLWAFKYQALLRTFDMTIEQDAVAPVNPMIHYPWGIEFSPNGRWLTASRRLPRGPEHETFVWEIAPPEKVAGPARSGQ